MIEKPVQTADLGNTSFWDTVIKSWMDLSSTYWHAAYEQTLDRLTQLPPLGLNREVNLKLLRAFDAWARLYPTGLAYQQVLLEVQLRALEELLQTLTAMAQQGEPLKDWVQLQQLWGNIVDRVFEATFVAEPNLRVRGSFVNAINHSRICQQELMEVWLNWMNLPTRREIDEIHKTIYELRKEVRRLQQALARDEL